MPEEYILRNEPVLSVAKSDGAVFPLNSRVLFDAIKNCHQIIDKISEVPVEIFNLLGMRNLSAFIGELYSASIRISAGDIFIKNPHQDGYPDLLLMDQSGRDLIDSLRGRLRDKSPFSPFANGGVEVKATCGSLPTPEQCLKKGFEKPDIGDERIVCMTGYDWKAHHRDTNNLTGLIWDFIDRKPRIVAVFYSNNLNSEHWGKIVQPKEGGGRTTSVSIMTREGIRVMYNGWVLFRNDRRYANFIDRYNGGTELQAAYSSLKPIAIC